MKLINRKFRKPPKPYFQRAAENIKPKPEPKKYEKRDILKLKRQLRRRIAQIKAHETEIDRLEIEAEKLQAEVIEAEMQHRPVQVVQTFSPKTRKRTASTEQYNIPDDIAKKILADLEKSGKI
jgi:hypothetical protein